MGLQKIIPFLIAFLLVSSVVFASGGGDGYRRSTMPSTAATTEKRQTSDELNQIQNKPATSCETGATVQERVKCRLQGKVSEDNIVPEGCRNVLNPNGCLNLYRISEACYDTKGREKGQCFKRVLTLDTMKGAGREKIGQYMILLLYDLQQKVETSFNANKITSDEASSIISKIIETKRAINNGESKENIRQRISEIKGVWKGAIQ